MKQALSARYGGMLIHAMECDYNSFRHLHLLCPNCKRSVFLVGGKQVEPFTRHYKSGQTSQVKGFSVDPYFAHHPDVSGSEVETCELRVRSMTEGEKQKIQTQSRKQLLKVLHKHFWKILYSSKVTLGSEALTQLKYTFKTVAIENGFSPNLFYEKWIESLIKSFQNTKDINKTKIEPLLTKLINRDKTFIDPVVSNILEEIIDINFDKQMQILIVKEMIDFLIQPRQKPILKELVAMQLYTFCYFKSEDMFEQNFKLKNNNAPKDAAHYYFKKSVEYLLTLRDKDVFQALHNFIFHMIIQNLLLIDWAGQYEKYENEDKLK